MKRYLFLFTAFYFLLCSFTGNGYNTYTGRVTCEGKPIANVVVSDGFTCTQTDTDGYFKLTADRNSRSLYVSTPAGYTVPRNKSIPVFHQMIQEGTTVYDFELVSNPDDNVHAFIVQTDIQVASNKDLDRYEPIAKEIDSIAGTLRGDVFGLDCGDVVGDAYWLYPRYTDISNSIDMPIYRIIGNHDMNSGVSCFEESYQRFESLFTPPRYSFTKGKVHYIAIDNCFHLGREYFYIGYVDQNTLKWLEEDLKYVPKDHTIVLFLHIPTQLTKEPEPFEYSFGGMADKTINAAAIYRLLEDYHVHIISGHMHYNRNIVFNDRMMEHNTSSVCGTWWQGNIAMDGTPPGYGIYEVEGNNISWYYKSYGYDKEYQMQVYAPGSYEDDPEALVVNVWNWDEEWKVEWEENGKVKGKMERFEGYDLRAKALCEDRDNLEYDWIYPSKTDHLFRAIPKNPDAELTVKVTDRFGNIYRTKVQ